MTPALEVEGVAFAYPDGHQALFALLRAMRSGGHDRSEPTRAP